MLAMNETVSTKTLAHVGEGTPTGRFMREYWLPALLSTELKSGDSPVRLMLLGEKLVAFRDASGAVGILDERRDQVCPGSRLVAFDLDQDVRDDVVGAYNMVAARLVRHQLDAPRGARGALAADELLGGLLLRGREPLPSLPPEAAPDRDGRAGRLTTLT